MHKYAGWAWLFAGVLANSIYLGITHHRPGSAGLAAGLRAGDNSLGSLFITGLLAGLLTFGGAFTAVPYVYQARVRARDRARGARR